MNTHRNWTREELERHSVDLRQFIDFRQSTLPNGMRIIEAYNSSGLSFTILPDRGLDIWTAYYRGLPLTWISQGSPFPPEFAQPWLRLFNGGLLTTCGLTHVGPPETDPGSGQARDLHGLYTRLRTGEVNLTRQWTPQADSSEKYQVSLQGTVAEARLFGEQLRLERTYTLTLGEPTIALSDTVWNVGDTATPFMILYHCNVGYPLVAEGVRLYTAHRAVYPRDDAARVGAARWAEYEGPIPNYAEQVYFHHVKADAHGWSEAALLHEDWGLILQWDTTALPYLTQWKNTRQNIYVSGLEPGNCIPEGQNAARRRGRLVMLQPGADQHFALRLTAIQGEEAVSHHRQQIDQLQQTGGIVEQCQLTDYGK